VSHRIALLATCLLLFAAACSDSETTNTTPSTVAPAEASSGGESDSSSGNDGDAAPTGEPLVVGIAGIVVLEPPTEDAGTAPQFRWEPVDDASTYDLVVLGPEGPLWAWQGAETEIWLGGLPYERPPGVSGPVVVEGTCWSVVARDVEGHVVAASDFLAVSPEGSAEHTCSPGG